MKKNEKTLTMAAAKAGLSRKTARKYNEEARIEEELGAKAVWRGRQIFSRFLS